MKSRLPILLSLPLLATALVLPARGQTANSAAPRSGATGPTAARTALAPPRATHGAPSAAPAGTRAASAPPAGKPAEPARPARMAAKPQAAAPIPRMASNTGQVAAPPAQPPGGSRPSAKLDPQSATKPDLTLLMASAVTAADSHPSITAKMRQQIRLFGQQLVGAGMYWQQGRGAKRRFRLELKVQVADGATSFEQVCTGPELWCHEDLIERSTLSRIDLRRVNAALSRKPQARSAPAVGNGLPLGGLPKLLENLQESFHLTSATEQQLDQLRVWRIDGEWKPAVLAEMFPDQKSKLSAGQPIDWGQIPAHVPQRIVLTLGHDDLFPYRVEYLREQPAKKGTTPTTETLVKIELFEVQFGGPIEPQRFVYQPGDRKYVDETEAFLKRLGVEDEVPQDARRPARPQSGAAATR
jgi:hypothetical protein